jgi:hypothetical protein
MGFVDSLVFELETKKGFARDVHDDAQKVNYIGPRLNGQSN